MGFVALKAARKALPLIAISVGGVFVSGTFLTSYILRLDRASLLRWLSSAPTVGTAALSGASRDTAWLHRQRLKLIGRRDDQR